MNPFKLNIFLKSIFCSKYTTNLKIVSWYLPFIFCEANINFDDLSREQWVWTCESFVYRFFFQDAYWEKKKKDAYCVSHAFYKLYVCPEIFWALP